MALAAICGVLLNLILPGKEPFNENMLEEIESSDKQKIA
jgi:uracil permease